MTRDVVMRPQVERKEHRLAIDGTKEVADVNGECDGLVGAWEGRGRLVGLGREC
jgi:hypothetical protein